MAANNIYIQVDFNSQQAQQNVNALNQAIGQTGPTAAKSSQQATTALGSVQVSVQQTTRAFGELTMALAGLGIGRVVSNMVQVGSELGRAQTMMQAFTGSAAEAAKVFEQIRSIAAQSPFRFKDLEETARALLGFGAAAKDVPATIKIVTDQVAAMGGSIENVNSIIRIFGRVMDKDFVGAMDLMRLLPQQGVKVMDALREAVGRSMGIGIATVQEVQKAMKEGVLEPAETMRVILRAMQQETGGAAAKITDFAKFLKTLADAFDDAKKELMGPTGFGPALANLAEEIKSFLTPFAALIDWLVKLPPHTKEVIVNLAAITAGVVAFSTALTVLTTVAGPAVTAISAIAGAIGKALLVVLANPELLAAMATITAFVVGFVTLYPEQAKKLEETAENWVGGLWKKLKDKVGAMAKESGLFPDNLNPPELDKGSGDILQETADNLQKTQDKVKEWADAANKTLLDALGSPADAVAIKYKDLFDKLNQDIKDLHISVQHAAELRQQLTDAQQAETSAKTLQKEKQHIEELAKLDEERVKGSYEAQIAYIEALDEQDLRKKVAAIDKVTALRIASAQEVAKVQDDELQQVFEAQKEAAAALQNPDDRAAAIANAQKEMTARQALIDQKAVDDGQKYRLEGWKKANDAIIEDQKRVFDAFKSEFDELFDAFTSKSPGKAIGEVFKKLAMGEAKDIFSSTAASYATQAAGYGQPASEITRGGGIISQLLRRGMPPRPPGPPPDLYEAARPHSDINYGEDQSANRFAISTSTYDTATVRFAIAVAKFSGAGGSNQGDANRSADDGSAPSGPEAAVLAEVRRRESSGNYAAKNSTTTASGAYQFTNGTWRMATQATGIGTQYGTAKEAPQAVQDANALWLLRKYGPNSTTSWAASGPYSTPTAGAIDTGGAAFTTSVYSPRPSDVVTSGSGSADDYTSPGVSTAMGGVMSLPTQSHIFDAANMPVLMKTASGAVGFIPGAQKGFDLLKAFGGSYAGSGGLSRIGTNIGQYGAAFNAPDATFAAKFQALSTGPFAGTPAGPAAGAIGMGLATAGIFGEHRGTPGGVLMATGGGFLAAGPIGAAVGFGIGIGEVAAGVESPRNEAKRLVRQLYRLNINNQTADQIVSLAQQSYGGRVSVAVRSPEVRHMLGLYAAGTGQNMAASTNDPHGASLVEAGGTLQQQASYQYGTPYAYGSNLPVYGGVPAHPLGPPGGLSLSLNIGGQDAAKFMTGQVVTPDVVQTQYASAMNGSSGRVAQALMMSEPGSIAS